MTNGIIFFVCSTTAISALFAAPRISELHHRKDGEKDAGAKGEERSVGKSKSTAMNLSSHVPTSSSSAKKVRLRPKVPGILTAQGKPESRMRGNSESDAASSSQAPLKDAYLGGLMDTATGKPVATEEESGDVYLSESGTGSEEDVTGKPVAYKKSYGETPLHPVNQTAREVQKPKGQNGHTIHKCLRPQFIIQKQYSRSSGRIHGREGDDPHG